MAKRVTDQASGQGLDDVVGTRQETRWKLVKVFGGLLGVRWELAEGNRELARKASRVRQKMTKRLTRSSLEVVRKIAGRVRGKKTERLIESSSEVAGKLIGIGNSLGVRQKLAEGIEGLPGWCKGVCQKKIETHQKIVGGSRKACRDLGIGLGSDDAVGSHQKFARRFVEGIGKLIGNAKGDYRRTYCKIIGGYQIIRKLGLISA
ncbi:hypothetical protein BHE74_00020981 [Ensete ventricosum]|nr:hypothetical protein BHE74_00020981 [Ensete ventricosum]